MLCFFEIFKCYNYGNFNFINHRNKEIEMNQISQTWNMLAKSADTPSSLMYSESSQKFVRVFFAMSGDLAAEFNSDARHLDKGILNLIQKTARQVIGLESTYVPGGWSELSELSQRIGTVQSGLSSKKLGEPVRKELAQLQQLIGKVKQAQGVLGIQSAMSTPMPTQALPFATYTQQPVMVHDATLADALNQFDTPPTIPSRSRAPAKSLTDIIPVAIRPSSTTIARAANSPLITRMHEMHQYGDRFSKDQIAALVLAGSALAEAIKSGEAEKTIPRGELRKDAMIAFGWYLMAQAHTRGKAFSQGMFTISDPHNKIHDFFYADSYRRASSHFKERTAEHRGIDCTKACAGFLPGALRTVVFAKLDADKCKGEEARLYLKPENWGTNITFDAPTYTEMAYNLGEALMHGTDFLWTRGVDPSQAGLRKEHLERALRVQATEIFSLMDQLLPRSSGFNMDEAMSQMTAYGLKGIAQIIERWAPTIKAMKPVSSSSSAGVSPAGVILNKMEAFAKLAESKFGERWYLQKGNEVRMDQSVSQSQFERLLTIK